MNFDAAEAGQSIQWLPTDWKTWVRFVTEAFETFSWPEWPLTAGLTFRRYKGDRRIKPIAQLNLVPSSRPRQNGRLHKSVLCATDEIQVQDSMNQIPALSHHSADSGCFFLCQKTRRWCLSSSSISYVYGVLRNDNLL